jgi:predicted RNA-binding protein with PIN domain
MIIVIDGYNLLKQVFDPNNISEKKRTAFVNVLGKYREKKGHKIVIIFDAGPCIAPLKEKQRGIQVLFSGQYQTADDLIIQFVQENPTKEIMVVTADRKIKEATKSQLVEIVDPLYFYAKVKEALASNQTHKKNEYQVIKLTQDSNEEIDALMQKAAGMKIFEKNKQEEYYGPRNHQIKKQQLSKKERKKNKKIDKL